MENIYKLKPITSNNFTYMFHKKRKKGKKNPRSFVFQTPISCGKKKKEWIHKRIEKVIFKGLILVINKAWICAN